MRLADFIELEKEAILAAWEDFARSIALPAGAMTNTALRNHASQMLETIVADLRSFQSSETQQRKSKGLAALLPGHTHAEIHGSERHDSGFNIVQLVSEYRALRASVLALWSKQSQINVDQQYYNDLVRFNEAIDQALAESVSVFAEMSRARLATESARKDEFLAMLAHELRNPLAPIKSAAAMLDLGVADETMIKKIAGILGRQVNHITGVVDDLLDVSRVNKGLIEIERHLVNVCHVVADAVEQASSLIRSRHHHLVIHLPPDQAMVMGDHKRLVQVLANLLTNAAKYTPDGGNIRLCMTIEPTQLILAVEDNGVGISDQLKEHIFEIFTQAHRTSDRSSGGLGLGLALVKKLIELHEGKVICASAGANKGSTFTVYLPRVSNNNAWVERRRVSRIALENTPPLKIMIVDDNVDAAEMLHSFLSRIGHRVFSTSWAREALELAVKEVPDVFLLDIGLPEIDGLELVKRMRARPLHSKAIFIAISGYGQEIDKHNSLAAGFDRHLVKPIDLAELSRTLTELRSN